MTSILVIEISHSSLTKDLQQKQPIYAAAGIQENWILDSKEISINRDKILNIAIAPFNPS